LSYDKGHTGPNSGLDRSDQSTPSLSRIKESWCFSSCKRLPCWVRRNHPLNIKGYDRLRGYYPFHFYLQTLAYATTLLSLFVSTAFKDVLSGLPTSEQPYAWPSLTGSLPSGGRSFSLAHLRTLVRPVLLTGQTSLGRSFGNFDCCAI
jgi:hypothetical protein